jgi:ABC-2 type transport system permease protein
MIQSLRAEFKKLLTVRSTYFLALLIIFLSGLFTYLGTSRQFVATECPAPNTSETNNTASSTGTKTPIKNCTPKLNSNLPKDKIKTNIFDTATGASVLMAVAIILLMAHEYRYNTITYSLTLSKSRSRVLAAKVIAGIVYVAVLILLAVAVTVAVTHIAVAVKGLNLPPQDINWANILGRSLFYCLGYSLMGLAIITLLRNLTAGIVAVFLLPTLDQILASILRNGHTDPTNFLPFTALSRVIGNVNSGVDTASLPSVAHAVLIFTAYLVGVWIVSWYLFLRRDAT